MKKKIENETNDDLPRCPECGGVMEQVWDNPGFTEPEGPSHFEIVGLKCLECGYEEE